MAKFTAIPVQAVADAQNVILTDAVRCKNGYILHSGNSGLVTIRGIANQCQGVARYRTTFSGNIAIPAEGTVGSISLAIAVDGEALGNAVAIVTPAAVNEFWNVSISDEIDVPRGCCLTVSVRNTSGQPIDVRNGNLMITRIA